MSSRQTPDLGCARRPLVAIVGAGLAGTLVAVHLLRERPGAVRVALIERSGRFGPGVAYGTADERHLLNVVAERMSALPQDPHHFHTWAARRVPALPPGTYLPRRLYGAYLRELLDAAAAGAPPWALERLTGDVREARHIGAGVELRLADGRRLACARCVVATGSPAAAPLEGLPEDPRVVADPWAGALAPAGGDPRPTLVVGTGLTAVDAVLSLCDGDEGARVVAVSRRGRLPHAHLPGLREPAPAPVVPGPPATVAGLEGLVREHAVAMRGRGFDWRDVFDGLRPVTPALWQALSLEERRRFVAERARGWEVRRHRMAPPVAARLARLRADRRLRTLAGQLVGSRATPAGVEVDVAVRGGGVQSVRCGRVVVCAGPGADVTRTPDPLLRALLRDGVATPDPLRLGLRTTADGALVDVRGGADGRLLTLGPLRRGELWETTAAGEIRGQAQRLAAHLLAALAPAAAAAPA